METRQVPGKLGKGVTFTNGDGYYFSVNNRRNGNVYMKCTECSVRGKFCGDRLVVGGGEHSHPPDVVTEEVAKLKQNCKDEAKRMLGGKVSSVFSSISDLIDDVFNAPL